MHVVSFSLDSKILDPKSVVASRNKRYAEVLDSYSIIVISSHEQTVTLSPNTTVFGTGGFTKLGQLLRLYKKTKERIELGMCDVITTQDAYFLALLGYMLAKRYHCGLEVQVHGIEKLNVVRKRIARFTLSHASVVRMVSVRLYEQFCSVYAVPKERLHITPIYVDVALLGFDTKEQSTNKQTMIEQEDAAYQSRYRNRFNIISVNRLVPVKNVAMQLQAIAALKEKYPQVMLHIVGAGPERSALESQIESCKLTDHVVLHGAKYASALGLFFKHSDCFVLTSHSEGWGMAVIEAANAGLPIVMTDVGCANVVIKQGTSGVIIKDNDVFGLTNALERIMTDSKFRKQLSENAQLAVASLPTFEQVRQQYLASWQYANQHRL